MTEVTFVPITIAAGIGLAVAMIVAGFGVMRSPATVARGRVQALVERDSPYAAGPDETVRRNQARRLNWVTAGLGKGASLETELALHRSGLPLRVGEYVALRVAMIAVGGIGGAVLGAAAISAGGAIAGALGGIGAGFVLPSLVLGILARRRAAAIERQLVELCELMASMMRGGYGYVQALSSTAAELGDPLASELGRLVDNVRLGADVDEELSALNDRLDSTDFEMLATAISIQRRSGGNLAEILESVAETIRYRQSFKQEVAALTSQARYSAVIVAGIPVLLVAALTVMDPVRYGLLFTDPVGRLILGAAMAMDIFGYLVIKQVSKVEA